MTQRHIRLVEVLGTLSLACDAADGFPHDTTMRSAVLAAGLAADVGDDRLLGDVVVGACCATSGARASPSRRRTASEPATTSGSGR